MPFQQPHIQTVCLVRILKEVVKAVNPNNKTSINYLSTLFKKKKRKKYLEITNGSKNSIIWSPNALKMSAEVMIPVLQTALLGFLRDFTIRVITLSLFLGWTNNSYNIHNKFMSVYMNKAYSISFIASLWYMEKRRTLLSVSQSKTQSFVSTPVKSIWRGNEESI